MKIGEVEEYKVENMRTDAMIAIDALESIVHECESQYVSRRYLREKASKAMSALRYIEGVANEEAEHE